MEKTVNRLKDLAICAAIALALLPATMNAQNDMFFRDGFDDNSNKREVETLYGLANEPFGNAITPFGFGGTFGSNAPIGSGLLIMLAAGAGYAAMRSKRSRRKTITLLLACALALSFTQCGKKKLETITTNGETVNITLNAGGGRHIIEPGPDYVPITYETGDVIYVSNGGRYSGKLICGGEDHDFSGTITINDPNDELYFYFLGGLKTDDLDPDTQSITVDISNQGSKLPVLSMGHTDYDENETYYSCWLANKCALVEFDFAESTNKKVKISNMLCEAKIDFTNHTITPTEKLDAITLYASDGTEKWGILLLSDVERKSMGMVYNNSNDPVYPVEIYDYYDGVTVPALSENNNFLYGNDAVAVNNTEGNKDNNVFVVSANANAVHFAPGNLRCTKTGATWADGYEWSFMEHQYDMVETNANPYCADNYGNKDVVSLFGWGCTGMQDVYYNGNQNYYMPYNTIWGNDTYGPTGSHDLSVANHSDWGAVVPNNEGYNWRLLTKEEWDYLLKYRFDATGKRGGGRVMNNGNIVVNGAIFVPEGVSGDVIHFSNNTGTPVWSDNEFATLQDLETYLNTNGALFLPAAGYREAKKVRSRNSEGRYWTSTQANRSNNLNYATYLIISSGNSFSYNEYWRAEGYLVRLAR